MMTAIHPNSVTQAVCNSFLVVQRRTRNAWQEQQAIAILFVHQELGVTPASGLKFLQTIVLAA